MTRHEILVEDMEFVQEGMKRLGITKEDIWQDAMIWGMLKVLNDLLDGEIRKNPKEQKADGKDMSEMINWNPIWNEETGHCYVEVDGIRLVYEPHQEDMHKSDLIGWYRPDGWIEEGQTSVDSSLK